jgi:cell division protein FtsB
MKVPLSVWDKLSRVVVFLLFLAGLTAVFFWYLPLIQQNQRYRKRIFELDARIQQQEKLSRHLRASIESIQTDPRTIERLTRERLGWARTNEVVIRFEQPAPAPER